MFDARGPSPAPAPAPTHADVRALPVSSRFGARALSWRHLAALVKPPVGEALRALVEDDRPLSRDAADALAAAVQRWAIGHGATHYTHWFHPLTGIPAEKHDSFVGLTGAGGDASSAIEDFNGSKLLQGEPDASSFPSGGLRDTASARGYTAWDPSSPIFVRHDGAARTLCIPCTFTSWRGHALDHKTPLLRARSAVERAALRVLHLLDGPDAAKRVTVTLGPEQEYFLIDRSYLARRPDLVMAGRTLLGAPPSRNQQLEDHYFAGIPARVQAFIAEVDEELWALGVPVKTRHNEVAPGQFETAPLFEEVNVACDHNALTMDVLKRTAERHGFVCLLHEKPFAGINGSGKHNNWSLSTDTGINLLDPGDDPARDPRFLIFLGATLLAVKNHASVLRATIASAGNDHRLGANEAPPPILSAYLGAALDAAVEAVVRGESAPALSSAKVDARVAAGVHLRRDPGDRNRTSPFAFTGNKFEFRAVGASENCGWPQAVLNAAVAETLDHVADRLESAVARGQSGREAASELARSLLADTRVVCFEGNGYSAEWRSEAARRGLPVHQNTAAALPVLLDVDRRRFLVRQGVLTEAEVESRAEVYAERYLKQIVIEARTLAEIVVQTIVPAVERQIAQTATVVVALGAGRRSEAIDARVGRLGARLDALLRGADAVRDAVAHAESHHGMGAIEVASSEVVSAMNALRAEADGAETEVSASLWPLPAYREMLFAGV